MGGGYLDSSQVVNHQMRLSGFYNSSSVSLCIIDLSKFGKVIGWQCFFFPPALVKLSKTSKRKGKFNICLKKEANHKISWMDQNRANPSSLLEKQVFSQLTASAFYTL